MSEDGFVIRLFLPDGDPSGRRIAARSHHTAEVYCVPRTELPSNIGDERLRRTGVYVLVGPSDSENHEEKIYIGEAGRLGKRITDHFSGAKAKDWWTDAFVLTKTDGTLDQADADQLEARLIRLAIETNRSELDNTNIPNPPEVADFKDAEIRSLIEDVLPIYKALGLNAFEKGPELSDFSAASTAGSKPNVDGVHLFLNASGASAEGVNDRAGFVVLAGSRIAKGEAESTSPRAKRERARLLAEGMLKDAPEEAVWRLESNQTFKSPSLAAGVVTGSSISGPAFWKTKEGVALKDLEAAEAAEVQGVADLAEDSADIEGLSEDGVSTGGSVADGAGAPAVSQS